MVELVGAAWVGVAFALVCIVVAGGLLLRYRSLERAGTPLPPGAGGARLRGVKTRVVSAHRPGEVVGTVTVLGDDWRIAEDVDEPLDVGEVVEVLRIVGTRLVVRRVEDARSHRDVEEESS